MAITQWMSIYLPTPLDITLTLDNVCNEMCNDDCCFKCGLIAVANRLRYSKFCSDGARQFLMVRSRDDTVRCIVSSLTDHESNDLMEELLKGGSQVFKDRSGSDDESESWETWQPDPVDANPGE